MTVREPNPTSGDSLKPTTPIRFLNAYTNKIRDRLVPLRKTEVDGVKFYYSRGNEPQDPQAFRKNYEMHREIDRMSGETAIDVGAHIGSYTLRMASRFRHVIAFEPNPFNRHILKLNIQLNKIKNVHVEDAALSDTNGVSPLFLQRTTGGTGSLNPHHYGFKYDTAVQVKVRRLDEFEIPEVDVLKIDAEGNELQILKGASQTIDRTRPILAIEVHRSKNFHGVTCDCETCAYLSSLSYGLRLLGEHTPTPAHWVLASPIVKESVA
jgi:FkbM family methyltransferase